MRPVNVFVTPRGNAFMTDIAGWIVEAAGLLGRHATLRTDGAAPVDLDAINLVVAPHEFYLLEEFDDATIHRAAQLSVPVCTEQPGTPWFDIGTIPARVAPLVLDINEHGVAALAERGLPTRHLRLGGVPCMRATEPAARDIDLVYLAGATDRRGARLATLAPLLWDRTAELRLFSSSRPVDGRVPGLVFGAEKYRLLARSRILLNIHRDDKQPGYFEWARFLEAMANGCCIVTEPVDDHAPFLAGKHFVETTDLPGTVAALLDDPAECARIGAAAQRAALDEYPLAATLAPILTDLDGLAGRPPVTPRKLPKYGRHLRVAQRLPLLPPFRPNGELRLRAFQAMAAETALQRQIERTRCLIHHGTDDHVERVESPAYTASVAGAHVPEVSVIVTLFDYAPLVTDTLDSIVASHDVDLELVVIDDHSRDDGRVVVTRFIAEHPDVPIVLLGSDVNRGLPTSRNLGFATARADRVMVMDADNLVYPSCLRKLSDALDADPTAAFAYATLECFGERPGVASAKAWHLPWLTEANYIDAQAMLRKSAWERIGGYRTDDPLVFGWEDWELWLRLAEAGEHGVHVPQMLGRYRTQAESMISTTNLVADHMLAHLRELHPTLPWPA